jgi:hypothetical protein
MFHIDLILSFLSVPYKLKLTNFEDFCIEFISQAKKCLIEEITHYRTVILRTLQRLPCPTFSFEDYRDYYTAH